MVCAELGFEQELLLARELLCLPNTALPPRSHKGLTHSYLLRGIERDSPLRRPAACGMTALFARKLHLQELATP